MKSPLVFPLFCLLWLGTNCPAFAQCTLRLDLFDSYEPGGDGWGGGFLIVSLGGVAVDTFTLNNNDDDGQDSTVYFNATDGQTLQLHWRPGFFPFEASFKVYDPDGILLFASASGLPAAPTTYTLGPVKYPKCLKIKNLSLENVWDTRARLRWTPGGADPATGWRVLYGPVGFVPGPGQGDTLLVSTPRANLTGLMEKTAYHAYIEQLCDNGYQSRLEGPLAFETYFSDDVGIGKIISPVSGCRQPGPDTVRLRLRNFGSDPQSLFRFNVSINGGKPIAIPPHDGFYTGVLGKDSSALVAFETIYDFAKAGEYRLMAYTELVGDDNRSNDTVFYYFTNQIAPPYRQDFENWDGAWTPDTTGAIRNTWAYGKPNKKGLTEAANGEYAWVTNLTDPLPATDRSTLQSPCFDFSNALVDPAISFALLYNNNAPADGGFLEMSLDGGNNWQKIGATNESLNWYPANAGGAWTGKSKGWISAKNRLPGAAGKADVRLRFSHQTLGFSAQVPGMAIDDIRVFVPQENDLSGLQVTSTGHQNRCGLEQDSLVFTLANFGKSPQSPYAVAYSLNGGQPVVETIPNDSLLPDEVAVYRFKTPFDSRNRQIAIRCWPLLAGDALALNDTVYYTVDHRPTGIPFNEDFESGKKPSGWVVAPRSIVTKGHHNSSYVLAANLYNGAESQQFIHELPVAGPVKPGDSLFFDYRITQFNSDSSLDGTVPFALAGTNRVFVKISTNCGQSFQTLYTINAFNHTQTAQLQNRRISLQNYAGKSVLLRLEGQWSSGDYWVDLDNIAIGQGPTSVKTAAANAQPGTLRIYPNPTPGLFTLDAQFERPLSLGAAVLNGLGQTVWTLSPNTLATLHEQIDLSAYPDGIYFIRIATAKAVVTKSILKVSP